jgi:hypothetical protein
VLGLELGELVARGLPFLTGSDVVRDHGDSSRLSLSVMDRPPARNSSLAATFYRFISGIEKRAGAWRAPRRSTALLNIVAALELQEVGVLTYGPSRQRRPATS